jgi:hypothetical protein
MDLPASGAATGAATGAANTTQAFSRKRLMAARENCILLDVVEWFEEWWSCV